MRFSPLFGLGLLLAACGGGDGSSATTLGAVTTSTAAVTTTTAPALSDPRFVETVLSARFGNPDPETGGEVPPDVAGLLALFYRSADQLVVVIAGFSESAPQCGWVLMHYGDDDVLTAPTFDTAPWQSFANQPWATPGATDESRCEEQFLEDGALRSDIAPAVQCADYVVVAIDQIALDPSEFGHSVATPSVDLIFDESAGAPVRFPAVPWMAHPGANPTTGDLAGLASGVLECSL